ncbi:uncharacterized protein LOC115353611 [Aquila chrysaetos chrysaetos]|uniref:uncharacterized protein LOC115353611 n=1 Tax=Aquila chrysaetos chrysaetos TaxID=223781 RepID=UPI001176CD0B|nr:uncharacterized protein LOC115353611 [Aquila chrysaetos chrysaetos]
MAGQGFAARIADRRAERPMKTPGGRGELSLSRPYLARGGRSAGRRGPVTPLQHPGCGTRVPVPSQQRGPSRLSPTSLAGPALSPTHVRGGPFSAFQRPPPRLRPRSSGPQASTASRPALRLPFRPNSYRIPLPTVGASRRPMFLQTRTPTLAGSPQPHPRERGTMSRLRYKDTRNDTWMCRTSEPNPTLSKILECPSSIPPLWMDISCSLGCKIG